MRFRFCFWVLALAAGSTLIAGCHAPRSTSAPASPSHPIAGEDPNESGIRVIGQPAPRKRSSGPSEAAVVDAHAHYTAAILHELNGDLDQALSEYYDAAWKNPEDEDLVLEVSRRFIQVKQPEKGLEILLRATAQPNASGALFARLGFVYSHLGKPELAMEASRTAIRRQPRTLTGYQNLFLNYLQNKQPQDALDVLNQASAVSQTSAEFLVGLAELYVSFALQAPAQKPIAHARALTVLQRAEKLKITELQLRLRLADGFNVTGKPDKAAQIYLELLRRLPDVPFVRENIRSKLADIYIRDQDRGRAIEQLRAIIRDNPTDGQAYYFLGSLEYEEKDYTNSIDHFSTALVINPDFEQAYYDLASAQLSDEKNAEALTTLNRARAKFSQNFPLEYLTASVYSRQKDYTNAINHFTAAEVIAQATEPRRLTDILYFQIGATYERKGEYEQAERYFEKCLQLSPTFAEAQNYLGYMLAERGEKLDRARELIDQALKAEPDNAAYLDSMAWVLFKLKQPKEALDYILRAIKVSKEEEDATVYDHLGDIYAALGQMDKARTAWRKSLSIEPSDVVRRKLEPATAR